MSAVNLLTPILSGGIQNINFVNGRVLTAEDMTAERTATLQRQRLMGKSVGDGVACGLEVTLSANSVAYGQQVVHITAGVAVNRNGDVMQLSSDTDVTLTATLPSVTVNGLFAPCAPPQTLLTNPGVYVLTVLPASGYQGQAPVTQLNSAGVATSCSSRYQTAGVQFRLSLVTLASTGTGLQPTLYALANQIQAQLNTGAAAATLAPQLSQLQNGLAHACFGTDTLAAYAANPFAGLPAGFELRCLRAGRRAACCRSDHRLRGSVGARLLVAAGHSVRRYVVGAAAPGFGRRLRGMAPLQRPQKMDGRPGDVSTVSGSDRWASIDIGSRST